MKFDRAITTVKPPTSHITLHSNRRIFDSICEERRRMIAIEIDDNTTSLKENLINPCILSFSFFFTNIGISFEVVWSMPNRHISARRVEICRAVATIPKDSGETVLPSNSQKSMLKNVTATQFRKK
jgi:hypothetical protein